jgi:integrase
MSSILTGAVDARHLPVNPLFGRRRTRSTVVAAAGRKSDEEKWVRPEVVLQMAQRLGPAVGLHVLTTAFTGLGWGEGAALHRDNVLRTRRQPHDGGWFECPIIQVDPEVGELVEYSGRDEDGNKTGMVLQLEPPKNSQRARGVDIPPFLAELLRYHLADWPHPYVFCTPSGQFWRRSNFTRAHIRPAADGRDALPTVKGHKPRPAWEPIMPGLTMRDLRHTHDTYQDQIGVRPALMYEQAGHARPGIKAVYQHPTPAMRQERLDGLQEIYERAMGNLGWRTLWGRADLRKAPKRERPPNLPQIAGVDEELAA